MKVVCLSYSILIISWILHFLHYPLYHEKPDDYDDYPTLSHQNLLDKGVEQVLTEIDGPCYGFLWRQAVSSFLDWFSTVTCLEGCPKSYLRLLVKISCI